MIIVARKHLPIGSSLLCDCMSPDVQIEDVALALLGHQVNAGNYYHVFIETLPTWHNVLCKYLDLCNYDEGSQVQLWLLEERGEHLTGLTAHLPALNPLYSCLSPTPPRHIKEHTNYGKVSTNGCLCVYLGTLVQTGQVAEPPSDCMCVYMSSVCPCPLCLPPLLAPSACPLCLPFTQSGCALWCRSVHFSQQAAWLMHDMCRWSCSRRPLLAWALM